MAKSLKSLLSLASLLACTVRADELSVGMLPAENWWGLCSNFGRKMPFNAKSDFQCDLRVSNYDNQSQSHLVSDKGRVLASDRLHPTEKGYRIWFDALERVVGK